MAFVNLLRHHRPNLGRSLERRTIDHGRCANLLDALRLPPLLRRGGTFFNPHRLNFGSARRGHTLHGDALVDDGVVVDDVIVDDGGLVVDGRHALRRDGIEVRRAFVKMS